MGKKAKTKDPISLAQMLGKAAEGLKDIEYGFHDPSVWVHTGCYGLNHLISGDMFEGFPMGKTMILAGESGSGKSYLSCSMIREAQKEGILPVILDSESALDRRFLEAIGVDTDPDKLLYFGVATVAQCQKIITNVLQGLDKIPEEERTPVLFVIDSLGMLLTDKEATERDQGLMKMDMGTKAKHLRLFFRMITNQISKYNAGVIATNHTYSGSDMYGNPKTSISGGEGLVYAASIVLMVQKKLLKENPKVMKSAVKGIWVKVKCLKTRFTQPFQTLEMALPYDTGLDPYSGLLEKFVEAGAIDAGGAGWYTVRATGEKFQGADKFANYAPDLIEKARTGEIKLDFSDQGDEDAESAISVSVQKALATEED
jgi:RecA/RadA recombinase